MLYSGLTQLLGKVWTVWCVRGSARGIGPTLDFMGKSYQTLQVVAHLGYWLE